MSMKAIADNATGEFTGYVNFRNDDPPHDSDTQTIVLLPRAPRADERWDSAKGVDFERGAGGAVVDSSVPLRGLTQEEEEQAIAAAAEELENRRRIIQAAPQDELAGAVADAIEIIEQALGVSLAMILARPAEKARWQRAQKVLEKVRVARS